MARYIPKDALVAEIEKRIEHNTEWKDACKTLAVLAANQAIEEDKKILSIINTLEVKDVDLDAELEHYKAEQNIKYEEDINMFEFAKHFYQLGLAQKGE